MGLRGANRGATRCKSPRHRWHLWRPWHCLICNLQILKELSEFESHPLRQSHPRRGSPLLPLNALYGRHLTDYSPRRPARHGGATACSHDRRHGGHRGDRVHASASRCASNGHRAGPVQQCAGPGAWLGEPARTQLAQQGVCRGHIPPTDGFQRDAQTYARCSTIGHTRVQTPRTATRAVDLEE